MVSFRNILVLVPGLVVASLPLYAGAIDTMNDTGGFFNFEVIQTVAGQNFADPPGYTLPTATENGDGTVTLANTDEHFDTSENIIDWTLSGSASNPYMDLTSNAFLSLNLTSVNVDRQYGVNILYFGPGSIDPTFLDEAVWVIGNDGTNLNPGVDVTSLAPEGAGQYFVRFRLLPPNQPGAILTLDSISTASATPEPDTAFLGLGGVCLLAAFRRRRPTRPPYRGNSRCLSVAVLALFTK